MYGCAIVVQLWAYEHLNFTAPSVRDGPQFPRFKRWEHYPFPPHMREMTLNFEKCKLASFQLTPTQELKIEFIREAWDNRHLMVPPETAAPLLPFSPTSSPARPLEHNVEVRGLKRKERKEEGNKFEGEGEEGEQEGHHSRRKERRKRMRNQVSQLFAENVSLKETQKSYDEILRKNEVEMRELRETVRKDDVEMRELRKIIQKNYVEMRELCDRLTTLDQARSVKSDLRMGCSPSTQSSPNTAMLTDKSPETEPTLDPVVQSMLDLSAPIAYSDPITSMVTPHVLAKGHKVVVITDSSEQPLRKTEGKALKEIEKRVRPTSKYLRPPFVSVDGRGRVVEEPTSTSTFVDHTPLRPLTDEVFLSSLINIPHPPTK